MVHGQGRLAALDPNRPFPNVCQVIGLYPDLGAYNFWTRFGPPFGMAPARLRIPFSGPNSPGAPVQASFGPHSALGQEPPGLKLDFSLEADIRFMGPSWVRAHGLIFGTSLEHR